MPGYRTNRRLWFNVSDSSDNFLFAINQQRDDDQDSVPSSMVGRVLAVVGLLAAIVACVFALIAGSDRSSGRNLFASLNASPDHVDLAVTSPFVGTSVVMTENTSAALGAGQAGDAIVRLSSRTTGAIVGLSRDSQVVALGVLPAGMPDLPQELLISPVSTALALGALHPDILTADTDTYHARLVSLAQSDSLLALVPFVDGTTAISDLGDTPRSILRNMVDDALVAERAIDFTCAETGTPIPGIASCGDTTVQQSTRSGWTLVVDSFEEPCAAVPPVSAVPSGDGIDALIEMLQTSAVIDPGTVGSASYEPGETDPSANCGLVNRPVADPVEETRLAKSIVGYGTLVDDAIGLAALLGASAIETETPETVDLSTLPAVEALIPDGVTLLAPAGRLRLASEFTTNSQTRELLGLDEFSDASMPLEQLKELLVELYR